MLKRATLLTSILLFFTCIIHAYTINVSLLTDSVIVKEGAVDTTHHAAVTKSGKVILFNYPSYGSESVIRSNNGLYWEWVTRAAKADGVNFYGVYGKDPVVFNNTLYMFGISGNGTTAYTSTDDGATWTSIGTTYSGVTTNAVSIWYVTVLNNKFYGWKYEGSYIYTLYYSSDGLSWTGTYTQITSVLGAPAVCVHKASNRILITYQTYVPGVYGQVYGAIDPDTCVMYTSTNFPVDFKHRDSHRMIVFNNRVYIISGYCQSQIGYLDDIWSTAQIPGIDSTVTWSREPSYGVKRSRFALVQLGTAMLWTGGMGVLPADSGKVFIASLLPPTNTPTDTNTPKPSITSTFSITPTITPTLTITPTISSTNTRTSTKTVTPLNTPTNTPTITPTLTVTPTPSATNTQPTSTVTSTFTITLTHTPDLSMTPTQVPTMYLSFLHYQECTNCGNCGYTLEWSYIPEAVSGSNNFFRVYYSADYSQYEDVHPSQNESTSKSRFVYTLQNMKWDKTYTIRVAAFFEDIDYTNTSNAIAISCFETPTPFAGTPTATDTPDCSPPTNTPTPQVTITMTISGMIAYEDFEGTPTAIVTPLVWTYSATGAAAGKYYRYVNVGGYTGIQPEDNTFSYENHYFRTNWANLDKEILVQRLVYPLGTDNRQNMCFYKGYGIPGNWTIENYIHNTQWWGVARFGQHSTPRESTSGTWIFYHTYNSETFNEYGVHVLSDKTKLTGQLTRYKLGYPFDITAQNYDWSFDSRGGSSIVDRVGIFRSRYVYFSAPVSTTVKIVDPTDTITYGYVGVTHTSYPAKADLFGNTLPLRCRLKIIDPNGHLVTVTDPINLSGGDRYIFNFSQTYPDR